MYAFVTLNLTHRPFSPMCTQYGATQVCCTNFSQPITGLGGVCGPLAPSAPGADDTMRAGLPATPSQPLSATTPFLTTVMQFLVLVIAHTFHITTGERQTSRSGVGAGKLWI